MLARFGRAFYRHGLVWLVPVLVIVLWQVLVQQRVIPARILPAPLTIWNAAVSLVEDGELLRNVGISTQRALIGLAIGGSIGFALGLFNALWPVSEKLLDGTVQMIRTVPHLALVPLVILWFGIGEQARIFLIAVGVFFPIYLNTFHGVRQVDRGLIEMGRSYHLSPLALFWQVILPGALPSILVGLRYALGIMWLTLIVAETIAANAGIGYMTSRAREFMRTDLLVFGILLYALLGKLADVIARLLERVLLPWHPNYQTVRLAEER